MTHKTIGKPQTAEEVALTAVRQYVHWVRDLEDWVVEMETLGPRLAPHDHSRMRSALTILETSRSRIAALTQMENANAH